MLNSTASIHWNGLFFDVPEDWDIIVKDTRHLIIEADLKPLLEIRWQHVASGKYGGNFEKIAARLGYDSEIAPSRRTDQISEDLHHSFNLKRFYSGRSTSASVLLLTCTSCATTILIKLYDRSLEKLAAHPFVLGSLRCHGDDQENQKWRIQDFYFHIPGGFELRSASFRLGLANLLFIAKYAELSVFRLPAAAQHLQGSSLSKLFSSLCTAPPADQSEKGLATLHYHYTPSPARKIWSALRRKKVYREAALSHFPYADRILGYSISSRRPIEDELKSALENGYGLIQEKKGIDIDQGSGPDLYTDQK